MRVTYLCGGPLTSKKASRINVFHMCCALGRLGHRVELLHPEKEGEGDLTAPSEAEPLFSTTVVRPSGFARLGSTTYGIEMAIRAVRGGAEVVYTRDHPVQALATALLGRASIAELHHPPRSVIESIALRALFRLRRTRIVAISNGLRDDLVRRYGSDAERIYVAHDAVDFRPYEDPPAKNEARQGLGLPEGKVLVVYTGSLSRGRGVEELIEACRQLADVHLVLVGGRTADLERLRMRARKTDVTNIEFVGHVPHQSVKEYLFAADILAMPYTSDTEAAGGQRTAAYMSPLKLGEYMAAGRAIVATELPPIEEVLVHERNALLVPPGRADAIRDTILRLARDSALRQRLGRASREQARFRTWEARTRDVLRD